MKYGDFQPTGFDPKGCFLRDQQDWIVAPVSRTRDTGPLSDSNFEVALEMLGGESDTVEVHRFGHWGPGWYEIIIVHPEAETKEHVRFADIVDEIQGCLENYPILSESDYSEREWNAAADYWQQMSTGERMEWCSRYDVSVFAARRDDVPESPTGELLSALAE